MSLFLSLLFTFAFFFVYQTYASKPSKFNTRPTGIVTTSEVVTLYSGEEINYDLGLSNGQEVKVKVEVLDIHLVDPVPVKATWMGNPKIPVNLNTTVYSAKLAFKANYSNPEEESEILNEFSYIARPQVDDDGKAYYEYLQIGNDNKSNEFTIKENGETLLNISNDTHRVYFPKENEAAGGLFKFRVTIEKNGNEFLAAKCKYLSFLPGFIYNLLTGNSSCIVTISNENVLAYDLECPEGHDEAKSYTESTASIKLGQDLRTPDFTRLKQSDPGGYSSHFNSFNKFKCKDANSPYIPQKARDVYQLSSVWNPKNWPDDYIECVAFVFMSYNMAGDPITKKTGNAISLAGKKYVSGIMVDDNTYLDQFNVYEGGKTTEIPKVGDLMVWKEYLPNGHVGIVTRISERDKVVEIYNSNSTSIKYNYKYEFVNGRVSLNTSKKWKPSYWSRKK